MKPAVAWAIHSSLSSLAKEQRGLRSFELGHVTATRSRMESIVWTKFGLGTSSVCLNVSCARLAPIFHGVPQERMMRLIQPDKYYVHPHCHLHRERRESANDAARAGP